MVSPVSTQADPKRMGEVGRSKAEMVGKNPIKEKEWTVMLEGSRGSLVEGFVEGSERDPTG